MVGHKLLMSKSYTSNLGKGKKLRCKRETVESSMQSRTRWGFGSGFGGVFYALGSVWDGSGRFCDDLAGR